jgi:hypothetical protein
MTISLRFVVALAVACVAHASSAQEPRTEAGARASVLTWLRDKREVRDTARVVADSAELWRRFVVCGGPPERPCTIADNRPVTVVQLRFVEPDTALVTVADYELRTTYCPGSRPLVPAIIGSTAWRNFTFVYAAGRWEQRKAGWVVC